MFCVYMRNFIAAAILLAGVEGIEPSSGVLETLILPMNYTPICNSSCTLQVFSSLSSISFALSQTLAVLDKASDNMYMIQQ